MGKQKNHKIPSGPSQNGTSLSDQILENQSVRAPGRTKSKEIRKEKEVLHKDLFSRLTF